MTSEQWQQAKALYEQLEPLAVNERNEFLHRHCTDEDVCTLVMQMLNADADDFLENSPLSEVREEIEEEANRIGQIVGGYTLQTELGQGGTGLVYLGIQEDEEVQHRVAIKFLRHHFSDDKKQFRRERKILASLRHPNIARLLSSDTTDKGVPFLVMEYVDGLPITEYCDQQKCTIPDRLILFRKVCAAVQYAHKKLIIHRDLKPGNIFVTEDGEVKVLDFGIAKLVNPDDIESFLPSLWGSARMTPEYASPEQLAEQSISTASDVYSLGVLLYELLTGHRPYVFPNRSPSDAIGVIKAGLPELPSQIVFRAFTDKKEHRTPEDIAIARQGTTKALSRLLRDDLDNIALKALRVEPDQRYDSVQQFSDDIDRYFSGEPVIARKPTYSYHVTRYVQRNKYAVLMGAIAFLILAAWLMTTARQVIREREAARLQRRNLYAAEIQQARQAWINNDLLRLKKTIAQWLPQPGEEDLRGFEWRYLWGLINQSELTVTMPDEVSQSWQLPGTDHLYVRDIGGRRKVFHTGSGQVLWEYQDQVAPEISEEWPLFGEIITVEPKNRMILWDVNRGIKKTEYTYTEAPLKSVAQLDETRIFTSDGHGNIKIRERATGKLLREIAGTGKPITGSVVIQQSTILALITGERTVTVHFLDNSHSTYSFTEPQNIKGLRADLARHRLLVHLENELVFRDATTGRYMHTLPKPKTPIASMGMFPNSDVLFLALSDSSIQILDANSLREIGTLRGHRGDIYFQGYYPDTHWLITTGTDHTARIWDIAIQKEVAIFRGHTGDVMTATLSADHHKLTTGSKDRTAKIWDIAQARQPDVLQGHTGHILTAAFSPDNIHVATAGKDSLAIISDIQTGKQIPLRGHQKMIYTVAFSPDGKQLATGSDDGTAKFWDTTTGRELTTIHNGTRQYKDGVRNLTFTHDGQRIIAGCNDGMIKVWETVSGKLLTQFRAHEKEVLSVSLSPDGRRLSSGSADRAAKLWDTATWHELANLPGHKGWVWDTKFSPDGKQLATGCGDHKIRLWDVATAQEIRTMEGHNDGIFSVSFTPDGKRLATCSDDQTVRIWNPATGEELLTLRDHTDEVWRVAFSADGRTLLSASWDQTARLYRAAPDTTISAKITK
jgi:WD40 repeat protein/serine/threonine protein kinase